MNFKKPGYASAKAYGALRVAVFHERLKAWLCQRKTYGARRVVVFKNVLSVGLCQRQS
jgi:hypothetical protein